MATLPFSRLHFCKASNHWAEWFQVSSVHTRWILARMCACSTLVQYVCVHLVICQLVPQLQQLGFKVWGFSTYTYILNIGLTVCYKVDSQLMHCKNLTEEVLVWILLYADDISLACDTADKLRPAVTTMDDTFLPW